MNHPLRCRCGTLRGHVEPPALVRAVCYCKDCQTYAHFLKRAGDILDGSGGTDVVAVLPSRVRFEREGLDALACMSLSPRGPLRWYAGCCNTPIGNTPRSVGIAYVGLLHECLSGDPSRPIEASFGPVRMRVNTESARPPVKATPLAAFAAVLGMAASMAKARLGGGYRDNPFFVGDGEPLKPPQVLDPAERARLRAAVA